MRTIVMLQLCISWKGWSVYWEIPCSNKD